MSYLTEVISAARARISSAVSPDGSAVDVVGADDSEVPPVQPARNNAPIATRLTSIRITVLFFVFDFLFYFRKVSHAT